jgi:segregation and condensation protein A
MINLDQRSFSLENFEGPIDFLLYLVQKHEVDIYDIPLQQVTEQYQQYMAEHHDVDVDGGAEFTATAALLLYLKSRALLPRQDEEEESFNEDLDPKFEVIHHLMDYCRFKDAAGDLRELEQQQHGVFYRGAPAVEPPLPSGVDHLGSDDLALLFEDLMAQVAARQDGVIHEEEYRVADKIRWIRKELKQGLRLPFQDIFSPQRPKAELIVHFLALLELMKEGIAAVIREHTSQNIFVISQSELEHASHGP